tara:strand:- start:437 stop:1243 length:807 start_codon:yes stop_codon:yes gene_type:complete
MNIFIYQHLGIGDIISNNGLVRYLIEINSKIKFFYIFCKKMHVKSAKFMYRDIKNIRIVSISNDPKFEKKEVYNYLKKQKANFELIQIGHDFYHATNKLNPEFKKNPWHCTVNFYKQFGLPYSYRFKKTFWKRNYKSEKKLYKKLVGKNKKYIFIHDDLKRGLIINTKKFVKKYKIIKNDDKNFIFDYGLILENAKELHLIESSFRQMTETLNLKTKKLFLYKDNRADYSMSLYNNKLKQWVGTSKKWKEIFLSKKETDFFHKFFKKQ